TAPQDNAPPVPAIPESNKPIPPVSPKQVFVSLNREYKHLLIV
ncbi:unnamed protein product, partial [Rotaria sordida]